jgi:hypothetical protein
MADPDAPPAWLDAITLRAMAAARDRRLAWGGDARAAARAVREVVRSHYPALPMRMIAEAVATMLPDPEGRPAHAAEAGGEALRPAAPQEVAESLAYALRFGADGKPRRTGMEHLAPLAAAQLVRHLESARFIVMRRPPARPHPGY